MMFAAATSALSVQKFTDSTSGSHVELLNRFTGHLTNDDFRYFTDWKRLIDLEADSGSFHIAESWLVDAAHREVDTSKTMSGLSFKKNESRTLHGMKSSLISFTRSSNSVRSSHLCNLAFDTGCRVVISTDSVLNDGHPGNIPIRELRKQTNRRKMHLVSGIVESTSHSDVVIRADKNDLTRIEKTSRQTSSELTRMNERLVRELYYKT
jgi:hypothetical protein